MITTIQQAISLPKRDIIGLSGLEINQFNIQSRNASLVTRLYCELKRRDRMKCDRLRKKLLRILAAIITEKMLSVARVEVPPPIKNTVRRRLGIKDVRHLEASTVESFSDYFRFKSCDQLRRLVVGFRFPDIVRIRIAKFAGEELFLITLVRL
jgi:hypothetical protein